MTGDAPKKNGAKPRPRASRRTVPSISDAIGVEMPSDLSDPQDENPASARLDHGNDATPSDASNSPRKEERPVRNDPKVSTSLRLLSGTNELLKRVAKRSGHGNLHQFALRAISEKIERLDYPSIEEIDRLTESQLDALHAGPPKRDRSD